MVVVQLNGGLGNWMFQVAFQEYLKTLTNNDVRLHVHGKSPHAPSDLMNTIFKNWKSEVFTHGSCTFFDEPNLIPQNWEQIVNILPEAPSSEASRCQRILPWSRLCAPPRRPEVCIIGYFQNYKYITSSFLNKITLPTDSLIRHPGIEDTVFLHIRGGDYLNIPLHYIDLDNYYVCAIDKFPKGTKFSIFTNDLHYANKMKFLKDIDCEFINESELDSLYLMSQCKGGICANSSFSWWGAYLNRNRTITLPSKWFNSEILYAEGYYFKEATIISV